MKRKSRQLVTFAALAIAGYFFIDWFQKRTINKISYAAGGFRVQKVSLSGIEFRMILSVTNESDVPAPVSAFIGRLVYVLPNGVVSVLGNLNLVNPVELPGFGRADLEFSMKSGLAGGAMEILNILTNGNPLNFSDINYKNVDMSRFKVLGTLKVGPLPITIDTQLA